MTDEQATPATRTPAAAPASGLATASLVLGIASIVVGLFFVLGWVLGVLGMVIGSVALRQPIGNAGTARTGVILSLVGFVLTLVVSVVRLST